MNAGSMYTGYLMRILHDIATCIFYTDINPFAGDEVFTARNLSDRKMQRGLLQFFKPENDFEVRRALLEAGRQDLIGSGCDVLIPTQPPREALDARRKQAAWSACWDFVHEILNPGRLAGDRPGREAGTSPVGEGNQGGEPRAARKRCE